MRVLGVDIGNNTGVVLYEPTTDEILFSENLVSTDLIDFSMNVMPKITALDPVVMVTAYSTRNRATIYHGTKRQGLLELHFAINGALTVYIYESRAKKIVVGRGHATKDEIEEHYKDRPQLKTEHERDAFMFIEYFLKDSKD